MEVFILGTGRSGTSIVNRLLGLHKDIWSFRHETQILSGLPPVVDLIDGSRKEELFKKFSARVLGHLYKRNVNGKYDAGLYEIISERRLRGLLDELGSYITAKHNEDDIVAAIKKFSNNIFESKANEEGKSIWVEKTPRNLIYADKIQRIYPDAKFINVVRDGREVVSSIVERRFWPIAKSSRFKETKRIGGEINLHSAMNYWKSLMHVTDLMRFRVGSENWIDVRLEDLSDNFEKFQLRVERFLNVKHDLSFVDKSGGVFKSSNASKSRWKKGRSEQELNLISENFASYLTIYGYTMD